MDNGAVLGFVFSILIVAGWIVIVVMVSRGSLEPIRAWTIAGITVVAFGALIISPARVQRITVGAFEIEQSIEKAEGLAERLEKAEMGIRHALAAILWNAITQCNDIDWVLEIDEIPTHGPSGVPIITAMLDCYTPEVYDRLLAKVPLDGIDATNPRGTTSLMEAVSRQNLAAVKQLLSAGASVHAMDNAGAGVLFYAMQDTVATLVEAGAEFEAENSEGMTPLLQSAWGGDTGKVKALLEAGADPDHRSAEGWSPLLFSMISKHGAEVARELIEHRPDLVNLPSTGYRKMVFVHQVRLAGGAADTVRVSVNFPPGTTPLMAASRAGHVEHVKLLLAHQADPGAQNERRIDAAAYAAKASHDSEAIQRLISSAASR